MSPGYTQHTLKHSNRLVFNRCSTGQLCTLSTWNESNLTYIGNLSVSQIVKFPQNNNKKVNSLSTETTVGKMHWYNRSNMRYCNSVMIGSDVCIWKDSDHWDFLFSKVWFWHTKIWSTLCPRLLMRHGIADPMYLSIEDIIGGEVITRSNRPKCCVRTQRKKGEFWNPSFHSIIK